MLPKIPLSGGKFHLQTTDQICMMFPDVGKILAASSSLKDAGLETGSKIMLMASAGVHQGVSAQQAHLELAAGASNVSRGSARQLSLSGLKSREEAVGVG